MESLSSDINLVFLNLFIGMCKGERGLPDIFRRLGYENKGIEFKFQNSDGEYVQPELILASEQKSHSLVFEWKAGPNLDDDQLRRYSRITTRDLKQRVYLIGSSADKFDVTIVAQNVHSDRIVIGLRRGNYKFPLLLKSESKLQLKENDFCCQELNQVFGAGLGIDWDIVPTSYIPFDINSKTEVIAEKVMQSVVVRMQKREARIGTEDIGIDTIHEWRMLDDPYKHSLKKKFKEILSKASKHEFKGYLKYNRVLSKRSMAIWDVVNNPIELHSARRSKGVKRISTLAEKFLIALKTGKHVEDQDQMLPFSDEED